MQWHMKTKRKKTGGRVGKASKKVRRQRGRDYLPARVNPTKVKEKSGRSGIKKRIALSADVANVIVNDTYKKTKILSVAENPANIQFVRRNVITKGAIINTELGKAVVRSRPGQEGVINAVLTEAKSIDEKKASSSSKK